MVGNGTSRAKFYNISGFYIHLKKIQLGSPVEGSSAGQKQELVFHRPKIPDNHRQGLTKSQANDKSV